MEKCKDRWYSYGMRKLLLSLLPSLYICWNIIKWLIGLIGDIDLIIDKTKDIGWIGIVIQEMIDQEINPLLNVILILLGLYWIFVVYRRKPIEERSVNKGAETVILPKETKPSFEIIIHRGTKATNHEVTDDDELVEQNPQLTLNMSFVPNQPMQFSKLYLKIEDSDIEPIGSSLYERSLHLPFVIENAENYNVSFNVPLWLSKKKGKGNVYAIAGGDLWKSKEIDIEFQTYEIEDEKDEKKHDKYKPILQTILKYDHMWLTQIKTLGLLNGSVGLKRKLKAAEQEFRGILTDIEIAANSKLRKSLQNAESNVKMIFQLAALVKTENGTFPIKDEITNQEFIKQSEHYVNEFKQARIEIFECLGYKYEE